jgi:hypothetical protein
MDDEPPELLRDLPVLFFYEDPEEKRQRVDGAQPAPASVRLPRLGEIAQPGPAELEYPLIQFPWEPWASGLETQSLARAYAAWLNETAPGRLAVIVPLLAQAGAPVAGLRDDPATLAEPSQLRGRCSPTRRLCGATRGGRSPGRPARTLRRQQSLSRR